MTKTAIIETLSTVPEFLGKFNRAINTLSEFSMLVETSTELHVTDIEYVLSLMVARKAQDVFMEIYNALWVVDYLNLLDEVEHEQFRKTLDKCFRMAGV